MMENKDDEPPKQFFAQRTFELADNGLTQQIVQKLPRWLVNPNRIWVVFCCLLGVVFLLASNTLNQLCMVFSNSVGDINGWIASIELGIRTPIMVYLTILTFVSLGVYQVAGSNR